MSDLDHVVEKHWDAMGGQVLRYECSCGEEWIEDRERCDDDDSPKETDEVIHMGWQEEAFATIRERLAAALARSRAVVDAATAFVEGWYPNTAVEEELDSNDRLHDALESAVADLGEPIEPACCELHNPGDCCDPEDCGPCCEYCPSCPQNGFLREAPMAECRYRAYVAGPYTSDPEGCTAIAIKVGSAVLDAGGAPFVPHLAHYWETLHGARSYEDWMRIDLSWLRCADVLLRIPGASAGADREVELARSLRIPVYLLGEDLKLPAELISGTPPGAGLAVPSVPVEGER